MAFQHIHELNIRKRLIILSFTGIIGMILITGITRYLDNSKARTIELERLGQQISNNFLELMGLEGTYILTMDPAILSQHDNLLNTIELNIQSLKKSADGGMINVVKSIMASEEEHSRIFDAIVENVTILNRSKDELVGTLAKINDLFSTIIHHIDEEEAMLMMDGESLSSLKIASRKETVDFKSFGNERMLNLFQNLLLYNTEKTYLDRKDALDKKIALAQKNIINVYKATANEELLKVWEKASLLFKDIDSTQEDIFTQWKTNRGLSQDLNRTVTEIKGFAKDVATHTRLAMEKISTWSSMISLMVTGLSIIVLSILGFITYKAVASPIADAVSMIKDIAEGEGDLTKRLSIKSKDEIGELALWFNMFIEKLQTLIADISKKSKTLDDSSETLSNLSGDMTTEIEALSRNAATVASSADDMSDTMTNIAIASEESATNINMLAAAAEEMSATIQEIANNTEKAHLVSRDAVAKAESTLSNIRELGNAASKINTVTEVITDISEQTNLLALNATIEAARAGEAGKGFAVVANEIKELARQTAEATRGIKVIVNDIQVSTSGTMGDIEQIAGVVGNINDIVTTIASSVEEQTATTKEIANNVSQASTGIQDISYGVTRSSQASQGIATDISEVNRSATQVSDNSILLDTRSSELSELSAALKKLVGKFIV
ncbi:MAG: methyl-accepting chemotaxis protein [Proteobacteria bacterium]|nr:methyl-accepting chemotaxis protein [Pseudomonadota bacterium]